MTATMQEPACPKCGGPMFDEKNGKFPWKPGRPIFRCRKKGECDGVIWEPKTVAPAPTTQPRATSLGQAARNIGVLPGDDEEQGTAPHAAAMLALHDECFKRAYNRLKKANEAQDPALIFTGSDVLAYTAQLFIEANRKGFTSLAA